MKHLALEQLENILQEAEREVPLGSVWKHYRDNKGEKPYTAVGHVITEADDSVAILYTNDHRIIFSRPFKEFTETVRGGTQKRFQKIS